MGGNGEIWMEDSPFTTSELVKTLGVADDSILEVVVTVGTVLFTGIDVNPCTIESV